uniref:Uncharacterized protein n=1 Tax=Timema poppense TaxID=170557 RepID=A0A7R9CXV9_TIMPO|nr:unnamed protein product [Timema poppensis]
MTELAYFDSTANSPFPALYEDDTEGEDALSPNLDNIITNNNDSESKVDHWKNPSFTVTDFDMDDEDDDSADYAADSDDCSL